MMLTGNHHGGAGFLLMLVDQDHVKVAIIPRIIIYQRDSAYIFIALYQMPAAAEVI